MASRTAAAAGEGGGAGASDCRHPAQQSKSDRTRKRMKAATFAVRSFGGNQPDGNMVTTFDAYFPSAAGAASCAGFFQCSEKVMVDLTSALINKTLTVLIESVDFANHMPFVIT